MENTEFSPVLHEEIHKAVEWQIRENNPKETNETLDIHIKSGYSIVGMRQIYSSLEKNSSNKLC